MRLFHFSEEPDLTEFIPRPVRVPSNRPIGLEWLNGALVWAIAETHQQMYLFPRECPRIVLSATPDTSDSDAEQWLQSNKNRSVAYIERKWLRRFESASLSRYEFNPVNFNSLHDAGTWVSSASEIPIDKVEISDLAAKLNDAQTDLKVVDYLEPLKPAWNSTVHASGIRLRNAHSWNQ